MTLIAPLLLALAQAPAAAPRAPGHAISLPPADWSTLPFLRYLRRSPEKPELSRFVRDEIAAGRCAASVRSGKGPILTVDLAVLVTPSGRVRRIVPRAIQCPLVEQYARGILSRMARDNIDTHGISADTWFRATLTFTWPG